MDDITVFPEMKTALRTYHPVPSLQKTDGNAQDAPRIKNCLKAALLQSELTTPPPINPDEILHRLVRHVTPSEGVPFQLCPFRYLEGRVTTTHNRCQPHLRSGEPRSSKYQVLTSESQAHLSQPLSPVHFDGNLNFLD